MEPVDPDTLNATAFLATTNQRLGNRASARVYLNHLRRLGDSWCFGPGNPAWKTTDRYKELLKEAESLIEGPPAPGK
jgi:hypothetical protein